jgi:hypothetical protein
MSYLVETMVWVLGLALLGNAIGVAIRVLTRKGKG